MKQSVGGDVARYYAVPAVAIILALGLVATGRAAALARRKADRPAPVPLPGLGVTAACVYSGDSRMGNCRSFPAGPSGSR